MIIVGAPDGPGRDESWVVSPDLLEGKVEQAIGEAKDAWQEVRRSGGAADSTP